MKFENNAFKLGYSRIYRKETQPGRPLMAAVRSAAAAQGRALLRRSPLSRYESLQHKPPISLQRDLAFKNLPWAGAMTSSCRTGGDPRELHNCSADFAALEFGQELKVHFVLTPSVYTEGIKAVLSRLRLTFNDLDVIVCDEACGRELG